MRDPLRLPGSTVPPAPERGGVAHSPPPAAPPALPPPACTRADDARHPVASQHAVCVYNDDL